MTPEPPADARSWRLTLLLLTLSGTAGLIYEVVWARQLILIFGATNSATTTVLTAFMLGLALGSLGSQPVGPPMGQPNPAYACFEFGIGVYGLAAWNDIGVTLAKQGQPGSALAAFERALGLLPDSAQTISTICGQPSDLPPNQVDALLNLATLMSRQGRWAKAEAGWRQVLRIDPANAAARQGLETASRESTR